MEDDQLLWYPTDECLHKDSGLWKLCFRDFKDIVYPFFESDTLFLECICVCVCACVCCF